jgi:N-acetylglucosaminyldiphosphoundecaprenol N-acetyl-beta-D-mannosaminyltransferase
VSILGVDVTPWDGAELIEAMIASSRVGRPGDDSPVRTVHYANIHVLNTAYRNRDLHRQLARASTVYCDGAGVVLGAALLGRQLPPRIAAADWIDRLCDRAARAGARLYFIAGAEGVAERAAAILQARHPGLEIAGTHHGFLDDEESAGVVAWANEANADIVLVGMGTPTQELWVARFREAIQAPVVWTVGAVLDFVVGAQRRAPGWVQGAHMEWLWRLGTDPARLARRYLLGNPLFCLRLARQRLRSLARGAGT